jgi:hypothetical protein
LTSPAAKRLPIRSGPLSPPAQSLRTLPNAGRLQPHRPRIRSHSPATPRSSQRPRSSLVKNSVRIATVGQRPLFLWLTQRSRRFRGHRNQ